SATNLPSRCAGATTALCIVPATKPDGGARQGSNRSRWPASCGGKPACQGLICHPVVPEPPPRSASFRRRSPMVERGRDRTDQGGPQAVEENPPARDSEKNEGPSGGC